MVESEQVCTVLDPFAVNTAMYYAIVYIRGLINVLGEINSQSSDGALLRSLCQIRHTGVEIVL